MQLAPNMVDARFVKRLNRFAAIVDVDGREVMAHVANSGRMGEMLVPGHRVKLKPAPAAHRKTAYDLALVEMDGVLVSADARLPNSLVAEALAEGRLPQFRGYSRVRREVTFGDSRLDFMLEGQAGRCYVETKSVTLVGGWSGLVSRRPHHTRRQTPQEPSPRRRSRLPRRGGFRRPAGRRSRLRRP